MVGEPRTYLFSRASGLLFASVGAEIAAFKCPPEWNKDLPKSPFPQYIETLSSEFLEECEEITHFKTIGPVITMTVECGSNPHWFAIVCRPARVLLYSVHSLSQNTTPSSQFSSQIAPVMAIHLISDQAQTACLGLSVGDILVGICDDSGFFEVHALSGYMITSGRTQGGDIPQNQMDFLRSLRAPPSVSFSDSVVPSLLHWPLAAAAKHPVYQSQAVTESLFAALCPMDQRGYFRYMLCTFPLTVPVGEQLQLQLSAWATLDPPLLLPAGAKNPSMCPDPLGRCVAVSIHDTVVIYRQNQGKSLVLREYMRTVPRLDDPVTCLHVVSPPRWALHAVGAGSWKTSAYPAIVCSHESGAVTMFVPRQRIFASAGRVVTLAQPCEVGSPFSTCTLVSALTGEGCGLVTVAGDADQHQITIVRVDASDDGAVAEAQAPWAGRVTRVSARLPGFGICTSAAALFFPSHCVIIFVNEKGATCVVQVSAAAFCSLDGSGLTENDISVRLLADDVHVAPELVLETTARGVNVVAAAQVTRSVFAIPLLEATTDVAAFILSTLGGMVLLTVGSNVQRSLLRQVGLQSPAAVLSQCSILVTSQNGRALSRISYAPELLYGQLLSPEIPHSRLLQINGAMDASVAALAGLIAMPRVKDGGACRQFFLQLKSSRLLQLIPRLARSVEESDLPRVWRLFGFQSASGAVYACIATSEFTLVPQMLTAVALDPDTTKDDMQNLVLASLVALEESGQPQAYADVVRFATGAGLRVTRCSESSKASKELESDPGENSPDDVGSSILNSDDD